MHDFIVKESDDLCSIRQVAAQLLYREFDRFRASALNRVVERRKYNLPCFQDLRGCLKSPDSVIFHRLCFPFKLPNSWGEPWCAYRES